MSKGQKITILIVILVVVLLGAYDVFALCEWGVSATISHQIILWSHSYPIIAFLFGLLIGHFYG